MTPNIALILSGTLFCLSLLTIVYISDDSKWAVSVVLCLTISGLALIGACIWYTAEQSQACKDAGGVYTKVGCIKKDSTVTP